jgi:hypothetical protein
MTSALTSGVRCGNHHERTYHPDAGAVGACYRAATDAAEAAAWAEWNDNLREQWAEDLAIANFEAAGFTVERIA